MQKQLQELMQRCRTYAAWSLPGTTPGTGSDECEAVSVLAVFWRSSVCLGHLLLAAQLAARFADIRTGYILNKPVSNLGEYSNEYRYVKFALIVIIRKQIVYVCH